VVRTTTLRLRAWWDDLRDSLWVLPAATVVATLALAVALVAVEPHLPEAIRRWTFGGSPEGARAVLSELAGATFTVTGVVFSLTIVALQMASSQFTPRLLRTFLRDRRTQLVLAGMVGSGVFDVAVLRTVRSETDDTEAFVPQLATSVAMLYALIAAGLLIYYLHHLTRRMRVDVIMADIRRETMTQLEGMSPSRGELPDVDGPAPPDAAFPIRARVGGYLQTVDLDALCACARRHGVVVRLRPTMGTWVSEETTLAWAWVPAAGVAEVDRDPLSSDVHQAVHLGPDRTESGDLAFGLRQLVDIAARALSTGVNDPTTAVQALGQLSAILVALAHQPLGADVRADGDGTVRAIAPRADLAGHLELAVDQIRRYGRDEPAVLIALAELLTDVAEQVADDVDRSDLIRRELDRTRRAVDVDDPDAHRRVEEALGRVPIALDTGVRPVGRSVAS
jgi:uncharacterized membrane protein